MKGCSHMAFRLAILGLSLSTLFRISIAIEQTVQPTDNAMQMANYTGPLRLSYPDSDFKTTSRWLIIAGRMVIPSYVYRVVVQVLKKGIEDFPLLVWASLTHNHQEVASGDVIVQPGDLSEILLQVPTTAVDGAWHLLVQGKMSHNLLPIFKNSTLLQYSPQFLTIFIQTSRPIYNGGQIVYFRAVLLTRELRAYEEPVDVFVLDPNNTVMRRWPSKTPGDGIVSLNFVLPEYPILGNWSILVKAGEQEQRKQILVELYFMQRFEVFVRLRHTFKYTDLAITGVVVANMTNWRYVYGNCTIRLQMATEYSLPVPTEFRTVYEIKIPKFTGVYDFVLPTTNLTQSFPSGRDNMIIKVLCIVGDAYTWQIQEGWALAYFLRERTKLRFLGDEPLFFRPGMPLTVHILMSYADDHPIDKYDLAQGELTVMFRSTKMHLSLYNGTDLISSDGVVSVTVNIPEDAANVDVTARFITPGSESTTSIQAFLHHSPRNRHLQVETSTNEAKPGEYIVLHVRLNFYTTFINYVVLSDGLVVHSGSENLNTISFPTVMTFTLPASSEMAPFAKILVWAIDQDTEIVAHSLSVIVDPLGKHDNVNIEWVEHKDHTGGSAEVRMIGEPGSYFAASAIWEETHLMDSGHDLDEARVLQHMIGIHESEKQDLNHVAPHIRIAATKRRNGLGKTIRFYPTPNAGPDAPLTFSFSDSILLTDVRIYYHPSMTSKTADCAATSFRCFTGGCYLPNERCNGEKDCLDGTDEMGCKLNFDRDRNFRLYRINRQYRLYDPLVGDWAWQAVRRIKRERRVFAYPKRPQNWVFSMFAVGRKSGFGILKQKKQFDSAGPFCLKLEAPTVARMWEQVAITVSVFNFHQSQVAVLVTIPGSDDFQGILVEKNGVVESYNPRRANGTIQHLLWMEGGNSTDIHIPIVFRKIGNIEITAKGSTQQMTDGDSVTINVIQEGAVIQKHTCLMLDLRNRAIVYEFLDIHLDETPIVPYTIKRRYLFGTPQGHVSIIGDIVGPAFPSTPVTITSMLGWEFFGAETSTYNFAANIWSLHYLRLTNQMKDKILYDVLTAVNVEYAAIARYQLPSGAFSNWINAEPSVWLTAHILKNLWVSNFQTWEDLIFIDQKVYERGIQFLLQYQTEEGSFMETSSYLHPLDAKVDPRSRHSWMPKYQNISLTGHVLLALSTVNEGLGGDLRLRVVLAKQRAIRYLESHLHSLTDPYDLAVVTWALTMGDSSEKDIAFSLLDRMKRVKGDKIYWSREPIEFNPIVYEDSQRPYLQPKNDNEWDAHTVESTAYALLVYIVQEGITLVQENIVRFLISMREQDGGWISTVDSLVAMEAVIQYSYRARIRDITDMNVWISQGSRANETPFHVYLSSNPGLSEMISFELGNIWGHLNINGKGAGQAILQLDYTYGVDQPEELDFAPVESFEFNVRAFYSGRNSSYVNITACQRWVNFKEANTSGAAVVDIHLPSGYIIVQDELIKMVDSRAVRNLRWASRTETTVKFFFNYFDSEEICFSYQIERWYPVSNFSRANLAWVYELYQPERLRMELFTVHQLYALDICEVCGSYQCPYCPFYSTSNKLLQENVYIYLLISSFFINCLLQSYICKINTFGSVCI